MNRQPQPRRVRRQRTSEPAKLDTNQLQLPFFLHFLTNPKIFLIMGVVFLAGIVFSLFAGNLVSQPAADGSDGPINQANELPDVPRDIDGSGVSSTPSAAPTPVVKRYTAPPASTVDLSKRYTATITTPKGVMTLDLYPQAAPEAVNAFVFLARDGYYNGTSFMQLASNTDGSKFTAQAGDPTGTGYGSPGFSIRKETSTRPFTKGAIGMGGSSATSNGGQFFISYGDYPALNGKYTIFGQVTSGLDVLERLTLLDPSKGDAAAGDAIQSIVINES